LLFLSIAGLGFSLWCPWKLDIYLPRKHTLPLMQRSASRKSEARSNHTRTDLS
jgi:hypothetical protein